MVGQVQCEAHVFVFLAILSEVLDSEGPWLQQYDAISAGPSWLLETACVDVDSAAKRPVTAELEHVGSCSSATIPSEEHEQTIFGKAPCLSAFCSATLAVARCRGSDVSGTESWPLQAS